VFLYKVIHKGQRDEQIQKILSIPIDSVAELHFLPARDALLFFCNIDGLLTFCYRLRHTSLGVGSLFQPNAIARFLATIRNAMDFSLLKCFQKLGMFQNLKTVQHQSCSLH
jgi:hypothetical protein